jgi:CesT_Tir_1
MTTRDDVRSYLDRLDVPVEQVADDMWVLRTPEGAELVVNYAPPVLLLRVRVMPLPADEHRAGEVSRRLLEYNARDLVHGSYGIEGNDVVLSDALELDNLDFNEFRSSVDSVTLALASHVSALAPFGER